MNFDVNSIPVFGKMLSGGGGDIIQTMTHWSNRLSSASDLDIIGLISVGLGISLFVVSILGILEEARKR